jgi:predicted transcriptional regulator
MEVVFDFSKLFGRLKARGNDMTLGRLAKIAGMSRPTLRTRLNGQGFNQDEITKICKALDIPENEIPYYFFDYRVELNKTK